MIIVLQRYEINYDYPQDFARGVSVSCKLFVNGPFFMTKDK